MKTLFLLRHAKSSSNDPNLQDFDRPLNARGRGAAELIGAYIKEHEVSPDLVMSSPAVRARETIEIILKTAKLTAELRFDQRIYEASPLVLIEVISQIEEDKSNVLLVGHNPGMESLVEMLTCQAVTMATGTLARINLKADRWTRALEEQGNLDWVVKPKDLALG